MFPDKDIKCHLTGFEKSCFDMVTQHRCRKWVHLTGQDPQSEAIIDRWDCADHLAHFLTLEVSKTNLTVAASVDKLVNEVHAANDTGMANALMGINAQIKRVADTHQDEISKYIASAPAPKQIEGH